MLVSDTGRPRNTKSKSGTRGAEAGRLYSLAGGRRTVSASNSPLMSCSSSDGPFRPILRGMTSIAEQAKHYLDGPSYSWGSGDVGPVAGFLRAIEAGGTIEEIDERVRAWAEEDFRAAERALTGRSGPPTLSA